MAVNKDTRTPQEKARHDLKVAEIVYYSIGGFVMLVGLVSSILGLILLNPSKDNFTDSSLLKFEKSLFEWLGWEETFSSAGLILMLAATVYFLLVFTIFAKKGDEVEKKSNVKKSRARQTTYVAPTAPSQPVAETPSTQTEAYVEVKQDVAPQVTPTEDK